MCVGVECREGQMWVWSDELVERVSGSGAIDRERVPLVGYAVGKEVDLDELAIEVLSRATQESTRPAITSSRSVHR